MKAISATTTLEQLLRERDVGRVVNPHVVSPSIQRPPDFDSMKRTIEASWIKERNEEESSRTRQDREVPKNE